MEINEKAGTRCVGFTVETKPDFCKRQHVDAMLELGVTRVEIGVQSLQEEAYKAVNRGHNLCDVIESFQIARDAGYKIVAHMMPGLPTGSPERDIADFHRLIEDPHFKPDMLKIYPTLVLKGTGLYSLYKQGKYRAYSHEDYIRILVEVKKAIPPWIRIMRVQ
jgi:elongator complex protein 3